MPRFEIRSADPTAPQALLKPFPYDTVKTRPSGGKDKTAPDPPFKSCLGNSIEDNRMASIQYYNTKNRTKNRSSREVYKQGSSGSMGKRCEKTKQSEEFKMRA